VGLLDASRSRQTLPCLSSYLDCVQVRYLARIAYTYAKEPARVWTEVARGRTADEDVSEIDTAGSDEHDPAPVGGVPPSPTNVHVRAVTATATWLRSSPLGMPVIALIVGIAAGFGAVVFRWLIFGATWLVTGHEQFGQMGRVGSLHFPWLGIWFLLLIPVVGGLLYGPLIQRFAKEARGHGVPEVMIAVAEDGGRIRPQVTVVKALASAICIGVGGSVGREGPIVQIGSALASSAGQLVRMPESRLRILVACGAAGGISATFNAPITGVFFGFELILREFSIDALVPIILSAVMADVIGRAFFGAAPIFSQMPHDLVLAHDADYLLVVVLGLAAALIGVGFKTVLYRVEDLCDWAWKGRPEWCRPAFGGIVLGALLLALPQMYGVGYPVMNKAVAGNYVLWFLLLLMLGKIVAASLTMGIGGSGGVFAPSLFTGAMAGTAFGVVAQHIFGPTVGSPAIYGVIAMGAVFAAAAQAPLTSIASVVEMTGNYGLALPVMLAVGLATGLSKRMTYGTIYTTKLLRRGTDIERPKPASWLQILTVADIMQPLRTGEGVVQFADVGSVHPDSSPAPGWALSLGEIVSDRQPQALFGDETLGHALRQLVLFGPDGLPVLSPNQHQIIGWVTQQDVLRIMADRIAAAQGEMARGVLAAEWAEDDAARRLHTPTLPLNGYALIGIVITKHSEIVGRRLDQIELPPGGIATAIRTDRRTIAARGDAVLRAGNRLLVLVPAPGSSPNGAPQDVNADTASVEESAEPVEPTA
jgi:CIC family chloride channel protein